MFHNGGVFTPYDWQEGIGNRVQYIESKLAQGVPVLAVSIPDGIVAFTYRRQARKIFEVYDRLIFAGIGQQSDVEALRTAAVDFAHQEGYNRSEEDVTVQRVAMALSGPLKKAFADFNAAPVIARSLFAEVEDEASEDVYYTLDYDGDYTISRGFAFLTAVDDQAKVFRERLSSAAPKDSASAVEALREIFQAGCESAELPIAEFLEGLQPEAVLMRRSADRENRFTPLIESD